MPEEWLGIWGIAGFGTGTSELRYTHTGIGLGLTGRGRMLLVHEDPHIRE